MIFCLEGASGVDSGGLLDSDIEEFEEEGAVNVAAYDSVGFDNILDIMVDEVIVGVDVLLDQTWGKE